MPGGADFAMSESEAVFPRLSRHSRSSSTGQADCYELFFLASGGDMYTVITYCLVAVGACFRLPSTQPRPIGPGLQAMSSRTEFVMPKVLPRVRLTKLAIESPHPMNVIMPRTCHVVMETSEVTCTNRPC